MSIVKHITLGQPGSAIQRIERTITDPLADFSDPEIREAMQAIHGEPMTGYEGPVIGGIDRGNFNCDNCEYESMGGVLCSNAMMKQYSKQPRSTDGHVIVHPGACCEYIERKK